MAREIKFIFLGGRFESVRCDMEKVLHLAGWKLHATRRLWTRGDQEIRYAQRIDDLRGMGPSIMIIIHDSIKVVNIHDHDRVLSMVHNRFNHVRDFKQIIFV